MVKAEATSYEKQRQERIEENKKRMEELNLTTLSQSLRNNTSPKPSPPLMKPRTPRKETVVVQVRRSSRLSNNPAPVYKQIAVDIGERPIRYSNARRGLWNGVYASNEARMNAIERAEELVSKLDSGFPSFVKPMLPSHVSGGFWLGLPSYFYKKSLPKSDATFTLIDESGDEWRTVFLAQKTGLSGGWMGFSRDHELVDGDALVFELVKPTTFKVYIIKANV